MKNAIILLMFLMALMSSEASAGQFAFYLVYSTKHPDTKVVSFRNDKMYRYMSVHPYIERKELLGAHARKGNYGYVVEIKISKTAQDKINAIVAHNLADLKTSIGLSNFIALGMVVNEKPVEVIQGMVHPITDNVMWCSVSLPRKSDHELFRTAQRWARQINNKGGR